MRTRFFRLTRARVVVLSGLGAAFVLLWYVWPFGRAYYLAGTATWPEKNHFVREADYLYKVLRSRPIAETGPTIIRCLADTDIRSFAYHNAREGEHSWRYHKVWRQQRAYYLAEKLWQDAKSPSARQSLISGLPSLLRTATTPRQKRLVIHTLGFRWNPAAKPELMRIASDSSADAEMRAAAIAVLVRHDRSSE